MTTFDEFYADYPRKEAKLDAMKAWGQALKQGFDPSDIHEGLKAQLHILKARQRKYIKLPGSWLRAGCWMDELEEPEPDREAFQRPYETWTDDEKQACADVVAKFGEDRAARMFRYKREQIASLRDEGWLSPKLSYIGETA